MKSSNINEAGTRRDEKGRYKKGNLPPHTGKKRSPETIEKMSKARIGVRVSKETKMKISMTLKGRAPHGKCFKNGHTPWNKGKSGIYSKAARRKMSRAAKKPSWLKKKKKWSPEMRIKHGLNPIPPKYDYNMTFSGWKQLREKILSRDNHLCQLCYRNKPRLCIHHIIPWRISKDNSRENLLTLCITDHQKMELFYRYCEKNNIHFEFVWEQEEKNGFK